MNKTELARGGPSNQANKQPALKADLCVFTEILAELLLIRDISFKCSFGNC